jgi:hypothetical protein
MFSRNIFPLISSKDMFSRNIFPLISPNISFECL